MNFTRIVQLARPDSPLRLSLTYTLFGALWILGSDFIVAWWVDDGSHLWILGTAKGLLFVGATTGLLYFLVKRLVNRHLATEEALRDSQLRWQFALDGSGDGLWDWNGETNRIFFSKQWKAMLGYAEDEIGDTFAEWEDRVHPEDLPEVRRKQASQLEAGASSYTSEFRMRTKDGSYKWILTRGQVTSRAPDGRPLRMFGTHTDITSRKSAEARTADALAFARTVLHHSPIGIITYDPTGKAVTANEAAARIIGTDVPGLLRQNYRELESWRRQGLLAAADTALATGREIVHSGRYVSSYGKALSLEERFVPFNFADGQHLLVLLTDETEQQRTHENLHLMNTAVQAAPGGWVVTDVDGNIQWVNPGFTALTGYTPAEVVGRNPRMLRSGQQNSAFYARMWQTIKRGEVWSGEVINQRKDGTIYQEFMTIAPVRGVDGSITQFVAMKQDISERKSLERQLARTQRLESIGLLASGIAHDLNNILAPITLSLELLRIKYPDSGGERMVSLIEGAAQRGAGIVRQVLTFARGLEGARTEVQPKHLLKDISQLTAETFPRSIRSELNLAAGVWPVTGDVTQLHQVLLNLAVNARDAMPVGGVLRFGAHNVTLEEGSTRCAGLLPPGNYVALTVTDTGTGIPPEVMERIFEPFFTTKEQGKGTGLGLSTVYGIVRSHGGMVEVNTKPGQGTEFIVLLPSSAAPVVAPHADPAGTEVVAGAGRRILVVDDEETIRMVTGESLKRHGFVVETARDGVEGLQLFQVGQFDAVVTDLMMPRMNGYQLVREIRLIDPRIPILASSGMTGDISAASDRPDVGLVQHGVETLLIKPYTESELLHALAAELRRAAGQKKD